MGPFGSNKPTWAHVDLLDACGPMDPYGSIGPNGPNGKNAYLRTADLSKIVSWKHMFHVKK